MDSTRSWSCIDCLKLVTITYRDASRPDQVFPEIRICSACHQFSREDATECWHCQGKEFQPIQYTTELEQSLPATHPRLFRKVPLCPDCSAPMKGGPTPHMSRGRPITALVDPPLCSMPEGTS